jgi:hypothetical protein
LGDLGNQQDRVSACFGQAGYLWHLCQRRVRKENNGAVLELKLMILFLFVYSYDGDPCVVLEETKG